MFRVLLWDLDNTLLNFTAAEAYSLKTRFSEYGLGECSDEMVSRYSEINNHYWRLLEKGLIDKQTTHESRFKEFFQTEGISFDDIKSFNNDFENGLSDKVELIEDGYDILQSLKGKVKQYAVTNGSRGVQTVRLKKSGLDKLFDGVFISDQIGYEKPSVQFFEAVLKHIPSVPKDDILIIGDSLTSDMKGGNGIGIKTCWYNPHHKINDNGATINFEIQKLNQIYNILGVG